jgi:hypothetical protein
LKALPLHLVYYVCCGLAVLFAFFQWHFVIRARARKVADRARGPRADLRTGPIPQPFWTRTARRLARWATRSR